jgi:hypothetical protein
MRMDKVLLGKDLLEQHKGKMVYLEFRLAGAHHVFTWFLLSKITQSFER